ncbi:MAG: NUDIX hydrolase [Acidobacteria bacterium]|nr:NUDIX hydrolase [Acidobacteriota bacterium]
MDSAKPYCYEHPRPALTVDIVVFREQLGDEVLLVRRKHPPFEGCWALPGGFVDQDEALDQTARRELMEETGIEAGELEQLGAWGEPGRDPRGHTVSVVYMTAVVDGEARADDDAAEVRWFAIDELPTLAFDHSDIVRAAIERIGSRGPS